MRFSSASPRSECKSPRTLTNGSSSTGAMSLDRTIVMSSLVVNIQYLLIMDGTQSWLSPTVAKGESSTETTNRLRWYGTQPIMACALSKYTRTIEGKWSKLDSPPIGFRSTLARLMRSNGVPAGMMWLTTSSCQRDTLSHRLNSRMDGFGATFCMEHWWVCNETCTYSLRWSPIGSLWRVYNESRPCCWCFDCIEWMIGLKSARSRNCKSWGRKSWVYGGRLASDSFSFLIPLGRFAPCDSHAIFSHVNSQSK